MVVLNTVLSAAALARMPRDEINEYIDALTSFILLPALVTVALPDPIKSSRANYRTVYYRSIAYNEFVIETRSFSNYR